MRSRCQGFGDTTLEQEIRIARSFGSWSPVRGSLPLLVSRTPDCGANEPACASRVVLLVRARFLHQRSDARRGHSGRRGTVRRKVTFRLVSMFVSRVNRDDAVLIFNKCKNTTAARDRYTTAARALVARARRVEIDPSPPDAYSLFCPVPSCRHDDTLTHMIVLVRSASDSL